MRRKPPTDKLVIGVLSAEHLHERRNAVWETWGVDGTKLPGVDVVFLIGDPTSLMPYRRGNCLYLPCPDDYESLPQKTRWFCLWALCHTQSKFLFKCDDDTYVHVPRLIAAIDNKEWRKPVVARRNQIDRYRIHGGAGYLLSRRAAMAIAARLETLQGLEDWSAGEALRESGLRVHNERRFNFWRYNVPQPKNNVITTHYCQPTKLRLIHAMFTSDSDEEQ